jgi:hypothetical protein
MPNLCVLQGTSVCLSPPEQEEVSETEFLSLQHLIQTRLDLTGFDSASVPAAFKRRTFWFRRMMVPISPNTRRFIDMGVLSLDKCQYFVENSDFKEIAHKSKVCQ